MIVAKVSISFDRGVSNNKAQDLGLPLTPRETIDGKQVRGIGTHWRDEESRLRAEKCGKEEREIRMKIRDSFLASPLDGVYIVPKKGDARKLIESMSISPEISVIVAEYDLNPTGQLPPGEVSDWIDKIKKQLDLVSLGKSPSPSQQGLTTLESLASCPILSEETRNNILSMIAEARLGSVNRIELKRRISVLDLKLDAGEDNKEITVPRQNDIPSVVSSPAQYLDPTPPVASVGSNAQEAPQERLQPSRGFRMMSDSPEGSIA